MALRFIPSKYRNILFNHVNVVNMMYRNITKNVVIPNDVLEFYQKTFDISTRDIICLMKRNPRLQSTEIDNVEEVIDVLKEYNINKTEALENPGVFITHASSVRSHAKILKECGFLDINTDCLVRYYAIMKKTTINELKTNKLVPEELNMYNKLMECFSDLPKDVVLDDILINEHSNSLDTLRMHVMQKYLEWRFSINRENFIQMTTHYHQFRHRPLMDIKESLIIALNEIKMPVKKVLSYPYVISADPINTRKILDEVQDLNGIDAKEALRIQPGVIRTNYKSIIRINNILKKNNIPVHIQKGALLIYTLKPETVESRLNEIKCERFYNALSTSRASMLMVLYKNRVFNRLDYVNNKMNKKCVQLYHLLTSKSNFESKINRFGDISSQKDVSHTVLSLLIPSSKTMSDQAYNEKLHIIKNVLSRHNSWECVSILSIVDSTNYLLQHFSREDIINNCHLVLYSIEKIKAHLLPIIEYRDGYHATSHNINYDSDEAGSFQLSKTINMGSFDPRKLDDNQILSLTQYSLEKEYFFNGDGIWDNNDTVQENT